MVGDKKEVFSATHRTLENAILVENDVLQITAEKCFFSLIMINLVGIWNRKEYIDFD